MARKVADLLVDGLAAAFAAGAETDLTGGLAVLRGKLRPLGTRT